jgi:hypothetical protein
MRLNHSVESAAETKSAAAIAEKSAVTSVYFSITSRCQRFIDLLQVERVAGEEVFAARQVATTPARPRQRSRPAFAGEDLALGVPTPTV